MFFLGFFSFPLFVFLLLFLVNLAEATGTVTPRFSGFLSTVTVSAIYRVYEAAQYLARLVIREDKVQ